MYIPNADGNRKTYADSAVSAYPGTASVAFVDEKEAHC